MMSQTRRSSRHFVLSSYPDGEPEDEIYGNLLAAPDTAEQMEFNIRYHAARMLLLSSAPGYNPHSDLHEDSWLSHGIMDAIESVVDASIDNL